MISSSPWGQRDCYYALQQFPAEHCQPYDYDGSFIPSEKFLARDHGMGQYAWEPF